MSKRAAVVCALAAAGLAAGGEERKPARVYTNEDLERVAPRRGETGVLSRPGTPPSTREETRRKVRSDGGDPSRGEEFWRREAARVKARVRTLQDQASRVREQIERQAEASWTGGGRRRRARGVQSWAREDSRARRLREILARIHELESDLEDRARRDGALPGWIR
jgi:hypothetical protein